MSEQTNASLLIRQRAPELLLPGILVHFHIVGVTAPLHCYKLKGLWKDLCAVKSLTAGVLYIYTFLLTRETLQLHLLGKKIFSE